jgi:hypothetical protein
MEGARDIAINYSKLCLNFSDPFWRLAFFDTQCSNGLESLTPNTFFAVQGRKQRLCLASLALLKLHDSSGAFVALVGSEFTC